MKVSAFEKVYFSKDFFKKENQLTVTTLTASKYPLDFYLFLLFLKNVFLAQLHLDTCSIILLFHVSDIFKDFIS